MNWRKSKTLMAVVICLVVRSLLAGSSDPNLPHEEVFTGAVSDNWDVANNWYDLKVADGNHGIYVGCPEYPNKSAVVYTGTTALIGHTYIGAGATTGSLLIQAGATMTGNAVDVGMHDDSFDSAWLPFDITDDNEWLVGGTGMLTVNGTITMDGHLSVGGHPDSHATVYLNAGGVIEVTGTGRDGYFGMDFHYDLGGHYEFYQAGGTLSVADNFHFNAGPNSPDTFYKMSGGTILFHQDDNWATLGYGRVYNGTFWVDGGTATIVPLAAGGTSDWSFFAFVTYVWPGDDANLANNQPVLKLSGTNPLLKVNGSLVFATGLLDVSELTIAPNTWITVVEANFIGTFTDWQYSAEGHGDGNDLLFAPGTDTNLWSMQIVSNKVEVMYIPEPAMLALLGVGAAELLRRRRRK